MYAKSLLTLYQIVNKPDFPSLADEIAEPHLDMNIKVATFTVSEKSINTLVSHICVWPWILHVCLASYKAK